MGTEGYRRGFLGIAATGATIPSSPSTVAAPLTARRRIKGCAQSLAVSASAGLTQPAAASAAAAAAVPLLPLLRIEPV